MSEQELIDYVKNNRKLLVNSVLEVLRNSTDVPSLVIMAGYPGSGKTEYIKSSPEYASLPTLDLDDLVKLLPNYKAENYYTYRKAGGRLLAACFDLAINRNLTFILEGTFSSEISIQNIERALKRGYIVRVVRMLTSAEKSWEYAQLRKKITGRPTDRLGFDKAIQNVEKYYAIAKESFQLNDNVIFTEVKND